MNFIDFLIIYLACGAPFGVYYFLHRYKQKNSLKLWLKTFFAFVFWIYFALIIFRGKFKPESSRIDSINEKRLLLNQKRLEKTLQKSDLQLPLFDFRETIERYAGLTLAAQIENERINESEKEIFRISRANNLELAAMCLRRRNRKRLFFHHSQAREDFLNVIDRLFYSLSDKSELETAAFEFAELLNDSDARRKLDEIFAASLQTGKPHAVKPAEKDLWKPVVHEQLKTEQVLPRFQTLTPTAANLPKKD